MGRRGNPRVKKVHSNVAGNPPLNVQTAPYVTSPGGGVNNLQVVVHNGVESCPQCHHLFDTSNYRSVQEACGHYKCRTCFINNVDGCPQCKHAAARPRRQLLSIAGGNNPHGPLVDDDLMPPRLVAEEPVGMARGMGNGYLAPSHIKELPPDLDKPRGAQKRKQNKESSAGPSKLQRTVTGSYLDSDRPPRRRSSISNSIESSDSSPRVDAGSMASMNGDLGFTKRSSRIENRKNAALGRGTDDEGPPSGSYSGRPSVGGFVTSPSRGETPAFASISGASGSSSGIKDKLPSFQVTISPTKLQSSKTLGKSKNASKLNSSSTSTSPIVPGTSSDAFLNENGGSNSHYSSDSSNSNSTEACDPLGVTDESNSAEANGSEKKGEVKKKKKRNPVTIHDHITVLSGDPPLYQCNVCMKKFKTKAHIKYHEFCQNGEKPFKCEQCGQGFIAKSHYEYHLRTHTGERPYVCPKCGKGFNQRGKVTRHMRSHTGEKPFICQQCGRGFANAQALRSHFLIHTGERPFACQYCNKRFTGMTNLKKHVITHTGERPFTCNHCGKSFGLKWTLDLHLRTHSTERPYACDQCTRAFSNSKDLRRHLVIHSGERPFKCWICGTAFRRKDNLDRHIKNTHNQPKEVAKQLANEAAADYMAKQNQANLLKNAGKKTTPNILSGNKSSRLVPSPGSSKSMKKKGLDTIAEDDVVITADISPSGSPAHSNENSEAYEMQNGQSQITSVEIMHNSTGELMDPNKDGPTVTVTSVSHPQSVYSDSKNSMLEMDYNSRNQPTLSIFLGNDGSIIHEPPEFTLGLHEGVPVSSEPTYVLAASAESQSPKEGEDCYMATQNGSWSDMSSNSAPILANHMSKYVEYNGEKQVNRNPGCDEDGNGQIDLRSQRQQGDIMLIPRSRSSQGIQTSEETFNTPQIVSYCSMSDPENEVAHSKTQEKGCGTSDDRIKPEIVELDQDACRDSLDDERDDYSGDPMLQECGITDDVTTQLQENQQCSVQIVELGADETEKDSNESILPDGMDCGGSILRATSTGSQTSDRSGVQEKRVNLRESIDTECPDNILEDSESSDNALMGGKKAFHRRAKSTDDDDSMSSEDLRSNSANVANTSNVSTNKLSGNYVDSGKISTHQMYDGMEPISDTELDYDMDENITASSHRGPETQIPESMLDSYGQDGFGVGRNVHNLSNDMERGIPNIGARYEVAYSEDSRSIETAEKGTQCIPPDSLLTPTGYVIKREIPCSQESSSNVSSKSIQVAASQEREMMVTMDNRCAPVLQRQSGSPSQYIVSPGNQQEVNRVSIASGPGCSTHLQENRKLPGVTHIAYVKLPSESVVTGSAPAEARLVYTNSNVVTNGTNHGPAQGTAFCYATNDGSSPQIIDTSGKYRFAYSPDVVTNSAMSQYGSQPSFKFVYPGGDPASDTDSSDSMRVVYACAAAQAEGPSDGGEGRPQKLKLLYAEALGVGTPDDSGHVQLMYTSAAPNQNVAPSPNQNVEIFTPAILRAGGEANAENIQMLFAQQPRLETHRSSPVPVEVMYNGNGTVVAQTVYHPQDLSWIRRDLHRSAQVQSPLAASPVTDSTNDHRPPVSSGTTLVVSSRKEIVNHHNYATNNSQAGAMKRVRGNTTYEVASDGLQTLARAASTRIFDIHGGADATTSRAAAAIAEVGRQAERKRQLDIMERNQSHFSSNGAARLPPGETIPHRGPRKHYLSQLGNPPK